MKFDDATEDTPSPQRHIDEIHLPLVVAYASMDAPEFQRQSIEFSVALRAARRPVEIVVCTNYNHFEALETLANPYGILGRAALRMMNLG